MRLYHSFGCTARRAVAERKSRGMHAPAAGSARRRRNGVARRTAEPSEKTPACHHAVPLDGDLVARDDVPAGLLLKLHLPLVELRERMLHLLGDVVEQAADLVIVRLLF